MVGIYATYNQVNAIFKSFFFFHIPLTRAVLVWQKSIGKTIYFRKTTRPSIAWRKFSTLQPGNFDAQHKTLRNLWILKKFKKIHSLVKGRFCEEKKWNQELKWRASVGATYQIYFWSLLRNTITRSEFEKCDVKTSP